MPTTGGLTPIRENLFYIGAAKQAAWNTPVAPTWWWLWLDGTDANPKATMQKERQGDTQPYMALIYKKGQYWEVKVVENARPQSIGYALQAVLGSGSDAYTGPTKNTTLSAAVAAGATSFSSTADLGNVGTLYVNFTPGYSSANYEVLNVNLVSRTGTGPYTYNLVAGQNFKFAHLITDPITTASTHVLTRQPLAYDAYSIDLGFGSTAGGLAKWFRLQDAICYQVKLTHQKGMPLKLEHDWYGSLAAIDAAGPTPVYEGQNVIGNAAGPLMWWMAQNNWLLDTLATGNAVTIEKAELTIKNSTAADDFQTEGLSPVYFIPGNVDIDGTADVVFQSYNQYLELFYGSAAAAAGATDSYITGQGALSTTWQADGVNSLALALPSIAYTGGPLTPKLDAKPLHQALAFSAYNPSVGAPAPLRFTLSNSANAAY